MSAACKIIGPQISNDQTDFQKKKSNIPSHREARRFLYLQIIDNVWAKSDACGEKRQRPEGEEKTAGVETATSLQIGKGDGGEVGLDQDEWTNMKNLRLLFGVSLVNIADLDGNENWRKNLFSKSWLFLIFEWILIERLDYNFKDENPRELELRCNLSG